MAACYNSGDFKKYFNENMRDLGLKTPSGLFDTFEMAVANAALMTGAIATLGKGVTMAEIAGATLALEKLAVLGALSAAGYSGAAIGSIAVASGRALGCGARISDLFVLIHQRHLEFDGWSTFFLINPEVLDTAHPHRRRFVLRHQMRMAA